MNQRQLGTRWRRFGTMEQRNVKSIAEILLLIDCISLFCKYQKFEYFKRIATKQLEALMCSKVFFLALSTVSSSCTF